MKRLLFYAVLALGIWWWWYDPPARWKGMPAAAQPVQTSSALPPAFRSGEYTIKPLAAYRITAVVLRRERYRYDVGAKFCPLDLALGWGPMSIASVINELRITQHGRFYHYRFSGEPPLETEQISQNSANTHCVPANDFVRKKLLAIKRHELVTLEGYLVEVASPDGTTWRSSLTRDDTEGGACEIVWVERVSRKRI